MTSGPEVQVAYANPGRDTLAAIAEELADMGQPEDRVRALARAASSPDIAVRETLAGRETLGAIAEELRDNPRRRLSTKRYGDRISNAPGAMGPARAAMHTGPEISVRETSVGRETLAAISEELMPREADSGIRERLAQDAEDEEQPQSSVVPGTAIELFEMMTFVARGEVAELSSLAARRRFVEQRLLHRLPVDTIQEVDRIDVTPWTERGTVIVRVWCAVAQP